MGFVARVKGLNWTSVEEYVQC